jgi:hypothetical protein
MCCVLHHGITLSVYFVLLSWLPGARDERRGYFSMSRSRLHWQCPDISIGLASLPIFQFASAWNATIAKE